MAVTALLLQAAAGAQAGETITYTYDELGRLTVVTTTGAVNSGQTVTTSFDPAGNRTNYTVAGASNANDNGGGASVSTGQQPRYFFNGLFLVYQQ